MSKYMSRYIPSTSEQYESILGELGKKSDSELFKDIPASLKLKGVMNIPKAISEMELIKHMEGLAAMRMQGSMHVFWEQALMTIMCQV